MPPKVYTCGYNAIKPGELAKLVWAEGAVVFDIRQSPYSHHPLWCKPRMQAYYGERYRHVHQLGNVAYKSDQIEIRDLEAGLRLIQESEQPVVLLCACKDPETCHRTYIAEALHERGIETTEIKGEEPDAVQLTLF